jgi:hypothetical protein
MKKTFLIVIVFLIGSACVPLFSKKIILHNLLEPSHIAVNGSQMYIGDKGRIVLYSLDNFKQVRQFGKNGEGPGEYQHIIDLCILPEYLVVSTTHKIIYFSRNGDYVKEFRIKQLLGYFFYPVGNRFVGLYPKRRKAEKGYSTVISVFDENMNPLKILAESPKKKGKKTPSGRPVINPISHYFKHKVYGDLIFIADSRKGMYFEIFNSDGKQLNEIRAPYKKTKITENHKKNHVLELKNNKSPFYKSYVQNAKFEFDEFYPPFYDFNLNNNKIYVYTYKRQGERGEIVVMDFKGKTLKTAYIPLARIKTIDNDVYYYLQDNVESEEWEFYIQAL